MRFLLIPTGKGRLKMKMTAGNTKLQQEQQQQKRTSSLISLAPPCELTGSYKSHSVEV